MNSYYNRILRFIVNRFISFESTILRRKQIWQCATPKSASTYLNQILKQLWSYDCCIGRPVPYFNDRAQEPDVLTVFRRMWPTNKPYYSGHLHQRYTNYFQEFFLKNQYDIGGGVIVQTRDLLDTIVSIKDHMEKQFSEEGVIKGFFFVTVNSIWSDLSEDEKYLLISSFYTTWHIDFIRSWSHYPNRFEVRYVDLISETKNTILEICNFFSMNKSEEQIENAIAKVEAKPKKQIRLNVGVSGRGRAMVPEQVQDYIKKLETMLLKS